MVFNGLPLKILYSINSTIGEELCFELVKDIKLKSYREKISEDSSIENYHLHLNINIVKTWNKYTMLKGHFLFLRI